MLRLAPGRVFFRGGYRRVARFSFRTAAGGLLHSSDSASMQLTQKPLASSWLHLAPLTPSPPSSSSAAAAAVAAATAPGCLVRSKSFPAAAATASHKSSFRNIVLRTQRCMATSSSSHPAPSSAAACNDPYQGLVSESFFLHSFAWRQWDDPDYTGTRLNCLKSEIVTAVQSASSDTSDSLIDGYAPFCKHIFIPNLYGARLDCLPITGQNQHLLRSAYRSRTDSELPVLIRWFPSHLVEAPQAKFLDVILYSRDQLLEEERETAARRQEVAAAAGSRADDVSNDLPNAPWGIICLKAQDVDFELPMQPITMFRNALGKNEGGSGVPLEREAYMKSVEYWDKHAIIADMKE